MLREDLQYGDVIVLILNDISGQLNRCDWQSVDKNFRLFDKIAKNKPVLSSLQFERWYYAAESFYRRGLLDKVHILYGGSKKICCWTRAEVQNAIAAWKNREF